MTQPIHEESPLEKASGMTEDRATEAFSLLGNKTRLAILLTLWEQFDPDQDDNSLLFSEIFEQIDYTDPGNFSYHLEQLQGQFIKKQDKGGYELRKTGLKVIQTVIAGAGVKEASLAPTQIDRDCWLCGAPSAVTYQDGAVYQVCTECEGVTTKDSVPGGYLNGMKLDPAGLRDRAPEELLAAAGVAAYRHMRTMFEGLCSACSGPISSRLEICSDHVSEGVCPRCDREFQAVAKFRCQVCKDGHATTPAMIAMFHPAVSGFYYNHGITAHWHADDFQSITNVMDLVSEHESEVHSLDPPEVVVTISRDGDALEITFDETMTVVDVTATADANTRQYTSIET